MRVRLPSPRRWGRLLLGCSWSPLAGPAGAAWLSGPGFGWMLVYERGAGAGNGSLQPLQGEGR